MEKSAPVAFLIFCTYDLQISSSGYLLDWTPTHTCRMLLGRREPTSRQNDQNTLKFGQKQHFYATILARRRQNGPRRHQTLKSGEPRSPDPGVSTGMHSCRIFLGRILNSKAL